MFFGEAVKQTEISLTDGLIYASLQFRSLAKPPRTTAKKNTGRLRGWGNHGYAPKIMPDQLSALYSEFLEGGYDCVDRVVCNAYFSMGQSGGGFRMWWRELYGSDEDLDINRRFGGRGSTRSAQAEHDFWPGAVPTRQAGSRWSKIRVLPGPPRPVKRFVGLFPSGGLLPPG